MEKHKKWHSDALFEGCYGVRKEVDLWVSDHFGIVVGIQVREKR